ncbi:LamG domain-containing protein [Lysinibacillus sp. G01H]|uniref:LamG domain-containing protein n=1 Tax=Lysinibacillus sp. G01H TaxID=3026425 RepID=UPI00237E6900|nr:LamG domain-containing protein [Lysinibacillus sp. G01H]WDU77870.1 LamG domain-containing protein [Lysinibacillus sp. G01H]
MKKSKAVLSSTLALLMLGQSSVLAESQMAERETLTQLLVETSKLEGLFFDSEKKNSVQLNKELENVPSTYEMIVKFEPNLNQRQILFGNFKSGNKTAYNIEITADNQLRYYEINQFGTIDKKTVEADITTGEWTHFAIIRDVANKKIVFIQDGKEIASFDNVDLEEDLAFENYHSIGKDTRDQFHPNAEITEVRLWDDVRTLDEIKDNVYADIKGNEEGLMHTWMLDDSVYDSPNVYDKAGKIDGVAFGFQKESVIEIPEESAYKGTGIDFSKGDLEIAADEPITEAPRTVEAWVKIPADTPKEKRVGNIIGNYYHEYYKDKSRFNFEITSNGNPRIYWQAHTAHTLDYSTNVNVNLGDWVHVAMVLDDKQGIGSTYINGEKINEQSINTPIPSIPPREELKIGSDYRGYTADGKPEYNFNGEIADVRLWSTARTSEEIKANYNKALEGNEEGLIGNWKLDDGKDGVYPDHSKKKNHAHEYDNENSNWIDPDFAKGDYSIV